MHVSELLITRNKALCSSHNIESFETIVIHHHQKRHHHHDHHTFDKAGSGVGGGEIFEQGGGKASQGKLARKGNEAGGCFARRGHMFELFASTRSRKAIGEVERKASPHFL